MREKLIALLKEADKKWFYFEDKADYLLKSGVIVPPVKVGDTVYCFGLIDNVDSGTVYAVSEDDTLWFSVRYKSGLRYDHTASDIGKTVFLTREEAEKALKECEKNA